MSKYLEIVNLTKKYGVKRANFNINFSINMGECYGIIGPNGAGKSTLLNQILGFIKSDSGKINVNGLNPINQSSLIMKECGFISSDIGMYDTLTAQQYLNFTKTLKDKYEDSWITFLIDYFEIELDKKIRNMSKGNRQKILIITALMHKPKFLVLDEPTIGLDPIILKKFNELIINLKSTEKITLLIASHNFQDIINICDKFSIIKDGELVQEIQNQKMSIDDINQIFDKFFEKEVLEYEY